MTMKCDSCGGNLIIQENGEDAICEKCGKKYTVDQMKIKRLENFNCIEENMLAYDKKKQISDLEDKAGKAYDRKNYSEAYNYYSQIVELSPNYWFALFRKSICIGWNSNLQNMHKDEVTSGISEALKLLYSNETQTIQLKSDGSLIVVVELCNWINSINALAIQKCFQYAFKIANIIEEFYHQEQIIAELIEFDLGIITEFVFKNYQDKNSMETVLNQICKFGKEIVDNMCSTNIINGRNMHPDSKTQRLGSELNSFIDNFQRDIQKWKREYKKECEERIRLEKEERQKKYWEAHAEEKKEYEIKQIEIKNEIDSLNNVIGEYNKRILEIKQILSNKIEGEKLLGEYISEQVELQNEKSKLGLFAGKKKRAIQEQINSLQSKINELQGNIEGKRRNIKIEVSKKVAAVEKECKPFKEKVEKLELERTRINNELTKER